MGAPPGLCPPGGPHPVLWCPQRPFTLMGPALLPLPRLFTLGVPPASEGGKQLGPASGPGPEPSRNAFSADPLRACRATEDLPFPGRQGPGFPWVKSPETRAHRHRWAGTRRKGSVRMPPDTTERGAPRIPLPEARTAACPRCRKGPARPRTALTGPPHWEGPQPLLGTGAAS